jgi:hypothetical protein
MDPSSKPASGEIPLPPVESLPPAANSGAETIPLGPTPEAAPANQEKASAPSPPAAIPTIPLPVPQTVAGTTPGASVTPMPTVPVSDDDDSDLIEKAWVDKAKQIVERNRDDPHKQSEALTVFKADYMKKRYGKAIKLS